MRVKIACTQWILQKQQIHWDHNRTQQAMRDGTSSVPVENICSYVRRVDVKGDWTASRL